MRDSDGCRARKKLGRQALNDDVSGRRAGIFRPEVDYFLLLPTFISALPPDNTLCLVSVVLGM